ncbi:hypothetical protein [uncultured Draconibacterium sp.]|uniref:hypothetical protein n=1 Tax=uncultured Draconibacterium sp. TaxID=1573823 RepID=UPI0025E383A3|nr:hypothetical protein [uncultured Draconibacterium sp.]
MKNKGIVFFLIVLAVVIVAVMVGDWYSKRPDNMEANKFEYSLEQFRNVPEELIHYKETRNFKLGFENAKALEIANNKIYAIGDQELKIIDFKGTLLTEVGFLDEPHGLDAAGDSIYIVFERFVWILDGEGKTLHEWELDGEDTYLTSVAVFGDDIMVADAGNRRILRFNHQGELVNSFEGKTDDDLAHGFIIPSPYFDLDINAYGDLWVVNPGMHTLENYSPEGRLREYWKASGNQTENFSGCCNPAHFCFLPDGSFVTSEKGLVRVKVYKPSGEFAGVVAPPAKFDEKIEGQAPDVAADEEGHIYALDFDRNVLRVFEKK